MDIIRLATWYRKCQPIAVTKESVIVENCGRIHVLKENEMSFICDLDLNFRQRLAESIPLFRRLFRQEIRCGCITQSNDIFFFRCGILYKLNLEQKESKRIWQVQPGYSTPLNILKCNTGKYVALFGDYYGNENRAPVNIYGVTTNCKIDIIYTFPSKAVRHIHNIIPDDKGGYFIFAGDDDKKAGIYHADDKFFNVAPVFIGDKQARAVIGYPFGDGLLFATDSVSDTNHIYYLRKNGIEWKKEKIIRLNGSCIYGAMYNDIYFFSTTVESPESDGSLRSLFSRKLASGILSDNVEIVSVDRNKRTRLIGRLKKDYLPYKLFQYGYVRFVTNEESDILCIYPVGVKKYDGKLGVIRKLV